MASKILLVTLNSTFQHSSLGLRYLRANLKDLYDQSEILELTINQNARDMAERILDKNPKLVGLGVYIWNTRQTEEVIRILKSVRPELVIVLGGPEVSHEALGQTIVEISDFVIQGEGEDLFYQFCQDILFGNLPANKILKGPLPDLKTLELPYREYTDLDLAHRVVYAEASRGCPYKCEYCLSSLDKLVRQFPVDIFLGEMQKLLDRGAKQFKFVDRTFNLSPSLSQKILQFFLDNIHLNIFLHFEMVPDRLPDELKNLIEQFPEGSLQFEVGIQTWNPKVAASVSRRQNYQTISENLTYLRTKTGVHTHADLILGLPGESLASFAEGFDALAALEPNEIQMGLLKRLKGAPISRHDQEFEMVYQSSPPFQILKTKDLSFSELQRMGRYSKFWDLYANSGHFQEFILWLKGHSQEKSFFWQFYDFVLFLETRHAEGHGISLINLLESAWIYLNQSWSDQSEELRELLLRDYQRDKKRDPPKFLRGHQKVGSIKKGNELGSPNNSKDPLSLALGSLPSRQQRHQSAVSGQ